MAWSCARAGRAVTLVEESMRKTLKQIAKQARNKEVIQSRTIAPETLAKYREKIASLDPDIRVIFDEVCMSVARSSVILYGKGVKFSMED